MMNQIRDKALQVQYPYVSNEIAKHIEKTEYNQFVSRNLVVNRVLNKWLEEEQKENKNN